MCMNEAIDYVVISTTVDSELAADSLSSKIVEAKLAACVQQIKIKSTYRWKGKVEKADEFLLLAKTSSELSHRLSDFIQNNHSYEVPEITITPITGGLGAYLHWIDAETLTE